jgi:hypothetical protein
MSNETINKRLKIISELSDELNNIKTAYQEKLEDDPQYQQLQEEAEKFKEETKMKKEKVSSDTTLKSMEEQMKDIRDEIKENREVLGQEIADYYKESGSMEFTDDEGNTKRIIFTVKLVEQRN